MRTMVAIVTAFGVLATGLAAQGQLTPDPETAKLIVQNERALYAAIAKGDRAAFQALTAPDGIWTTPTGFVPMGPLADGLGAFELPKWAIENPRVVWMDGDSALVLYTRTGGGRFGEQQFGPRMLASTLWTKRGGKWLAVHHQESAMTAPPLIPQQAQWEITFAQVEAAIGLADLQTASQGTVEARVMDRPWSSMARHPFLRVVRRDGKMRAQLFEFWSPRFTPLPRRPAGNDITCTSDVCVRPLQLKEQLDWDVIAASLTHQDACGVEIGNGVAVCGDCEQVWIKTTADGRYREQSCQQPPAGTSAATVLQFMQRSARPAAH